VISIIIIIIIIITVVVIADMLVFISVCHCQQSKNVFAVCLGVTAGNEEFQDAARQAVPDGHNFKGYPIQFPHRNARRAFLTCLK
jgi:hypothetical protein